MRTEFLCISVLRIASGPRVRLADCKGALDPRWFTLLAGLCLFGFVGFLFLLVSGKGCGL